MKSQSSPHLRETHQPFRGTKPGGAHALSSVPWRDLPSRYRLTFSRRSNTRKWARFPCRVMPPCGLTPLPSITDGPLAFSAIPYPHRRQLASRLAFPRRPRGPYGLTTLRADDMNGEDASCRPEALCPCIPTSKRNNRLRAILAHASRGAQHLWHVQNHDPYAGLHMLVFPSNLAPDPRDARRSHPRLTVWSIPTGKGTLSGSLHTGPLPAPHGPLGYCRGNGRFSSLIRKHSVQNNHRHTFRVAHEGFWEGAF